MNTLKIKVFKNTKFSGEIPNGCPNNLLQTDLFKILK